MSRPEKHPRKCKVVDSYRETRLRCVYKKVVSSISGGEACKDEDRFVGPSGNIIISTPSEG